MTTLITKNYITETIVLVRKIAGAYIELGERLKKIRDEKIYEGSFETFKEFLDEIGTSEATASKLISIFSFYVEKHGIKKEKLSEAGWSNLYTLMKTTDDDTSKKVVEEVVEKAIILRREDIAEEVRETKHPDCRHEWRELHLKICTKCNKREQIYND